MVHNCIIHLEDLTYMCAYAAQATNRRTLGAMVRELSKGGKLVWIAPSGGRDRPDADTGAWLPHKYDAGKLCSLQFSHLASNFFAHHLTVCLSWYPSSGTGPLAQSCMNHALQIADMPCGQTDQSALKLREASITLETDQHILTAHYTNLVITNLQVFVSVCVWVCVCV